MKEHLMHYQTELNAIINSMYGNLGGDPKNPIWFCAMERANNLYSVYNGKNIQIFIDDLKDKTFGTVPKGINKEQANDFLYPGRPGGSSFFRSIFSILGALITKPNTKKEMLSAKDALNKYEFMQANRLGLLFNTSPIGVPNRNSAWNEWRSTILIVEKTNQQISMRDLTGFDRYIDFFSHCARKRAPVFQAFQDKYQPAVIYCGGLSSCGDAYKSLWGNSKTDWASRNLYEITRKGKKQNVTAEYAWIGQTLVMIGPFFCNRTALNSYDKYLSVANAILSLGEQRFHNKVDEWLRLEDFLPNKQK